MMLKDSTFLLVLAMSASLVMLASCNPTPVPPSCPPIGSMATKDSISDDPAYSSSDSSSVEVFADTYAYTDPGGAPWCDTGKLDISPQDLSGLPACPLTKCLAAVNVKPDDIKFPSAENLPAQKPLLRYDLAEYPPDKDPEDCGGASTCYAIYQTKAGTNPWRFVGYAKAISVGSEWFAEGRISHFSIFALVELPDPTPVTGPRGMGTVVASDFIEDDRGGMSVGVVDFEDRLGELNLVGEQRILRFSGVDPSAFEGEVPPDCDTLPSIAEQFTCLFPIGTVVELDLGGQGQAVLRAIERSYGVVFFVSNVAIY